MELSGVDMYITIEVCKCCQELGGSCNCDANQEEHLMPEEELLTAVAIKINLKYVKHNLSDYEKEKFGLPV